MHPVQSIQLSSIPHGEKNAAMLRRMDQLEPGASLLLTNDQDPTELITCPLQKNGEAFPIKNLVEEPCSWIV